jgi:hypothetical protein
MAPPAFSITCTATTWASAGRYSRSASQVRSASSSLASGTRRVSAVIESIRGESEAGD